MRLTRLFQIIVSLPSLLSLLALAVQAQTPLGPGSLLPSSSEASDQKPGSALIFNFYTSGVANANAENTRISITNTSAASSVAVRLYFVDASNGLTSGNFICLTPLQTSTFLASDIDPGVAGYIVAIAVNQANGCPISHNFLTGNAFIKLASGQAANLGAMAFAALYTGDMPGCNPLGVTTRIAFDGVAYNRAPRALALDKLRSPADANSTLLVLSRLEGDLVNGVPAIGAFSGTLFDDTGAAFPFNATASACQFRAALTNTFPATTPAFNAAIPAGRSGWLNVFAATDVALLGAAINFNANAGSVRTAFTGGHNLDTLTVTTTGGFTIRVFPPSC